MSEYTTSGISHIQFTLRHTILTCRKRRVRWKA